MCIIASIVLLLGVSTENLVFGERNDASCNSCISNAGISKIIFYVSLAGGVVAFASYIWFMNIDMDPEKSPERKRVVMFLLITTIAFVPVAIFASIEFEIGANAPIGLVKTTSNGTQNSSERLYWIIHVGGESQNNYESGIKIPLFVFVFGIAGGYIKYLSVKAEEDYSLVLNLYKNSTAGHGKEDKIIENEVEGLRDARLKDAKDDDGIAKKKRYNELVKTARFQDSLDDLVYLFLSPLLAIVSYFILYQAGINDIDQWPTIVIVSFGAGLLTDSIIEKIKSFGNSILNNNKKKE